MNSPYSFGHIQSFYSWLLRRTVKTLLMGLLALSTGLHAQESRWGLQSSSTMAEVGSALEILARLPSLRPTDLDVVLTEIGFDSASRPQSWKDLSEREKLRQAYRWAQSVSEENATAFLVAIAKRFEARYESIAFDPLLSRYVNTGRSIPKVQFSRPTPTQLSQPLPREISDVIDRLSRYVDVPGPLGRGIVARKHFGLDGDRLLDTLQAREPRDFLDNAARRATPPPPIHERVNGLMQEVIRWSEAATHDAVLMQVAEQLIRKFGQPPGHSGKMRASDIDPNERLKPTPQESADLGGNSGGGGGGTPERQRRALDAHQSFENKHYSRPESRGFRAAAGRAGGRGGVIAGSPVNSSGIGQPLSLTIKMPRDMTCAEMGRPAVFGDVVVRTTVGEYRFPQVRCDVLLAARQLVFDKLGSIRWTPHDALGLASIDLDEKSAAFPFFLPDGGKLADVALRRRMVLHPALLDLPIGRSAIVLDLWPSAPIALLQASHQDRTVARWLKSMRAAYTWKWLDTRAYISATKGEITIKPEGRRTILAIRVFTEKEQKTEDLACNPPLGSQDLCARLQTEGSAGFLLEEFDAAAPILVSRVAEFADVEMLLKTLSLFRWARLGGVTEVKGHIPLPPSTRRGLTPDSLALSLSRDWIATITAPANWEADCNIFVSRFERARGSAQASKSGYDRDTWIEDEVITELQGLGIIQQSVIDKLQPRCNLR